MPTEEANETDTVVLEENEKAFPDVQAYAPQFAPPESFLEQDFGTSEPAQFNIQVPTVQFASPDDSALFVQLFILIAGFFCCIVWAFGARDRKHPNNNVALLAKINMALFVFGTCLFCISIIAMFIYMIVAIIIFASTFPTHDW